MIIKEITSVASYLKSAKPIVARIRERRAVVHRFKQDLDLLKHEAKLFDDTLKILLSWDDNIPRKLHQYYNHKTLLTLHGLSDAKIIQKLNYFTIYINKYSLIQFVFCKHLIYSPLINERKNFQCLQC